MSANDTRILCGLGEASKVDRVEIRWPSGARSTLSGLEIGREHEVVEPAEGTVGLAVDQVPKTQVSP